MHVDRATVAARSSAEITILQAFFHEEENQVPHTV